MGEQSVQYFGSSLVLSGLVFLLIATNEAKSQCEPSVADKPSAGASSQSAYFERGVNLAGAEFNYSKLPGLHGTDYTYPPAEMLDYYAKKGFSVIRLPFLWERVQPRPFGEFRKSELDLIHGVVQGAKHLGMRVILSPHNYGRYTLNGESNVIGSKKLPISAFADFWRRFAREFESESGVYGFSLMNEPHAMQGVWKRAAQAGVNAIRSHDWNHFILAPGDEWSGAWRWMDFNSDFILDDPAGKLLYEAHQYFDSDKSGRYEESPATDDPATPVDPELGVKLVSPFIGWLREHRVRGILTEFGVPSREARWFPVVERLIAYLRCETVPWTYWAGGPWWGEYRLSVEPNDGVDQPIMRIITRD